MVSDSDALKAEILQYIKDNPGAQGAALYTRFTKTHGRKAPDAVHALEKAGIIEWRTETEEKDGRTVVINRGWFIKEVSGG